MDFPSSHPPKPDAIADAASVWLSRRDRGLTAAEQDEYLQWLRMDPRHGQAVARLEQAWRALDALAQWRPEHSVQPNPDLLATPRRRRIYWFSTAVLAAVAALVLAAVVWWPPPPAPAPLVNDQAITAREYTHKVLPDGSVVELRAGAKLEVAYRRAVRDVRLVAGEAHFSVAKNKARPFVVHAGKIAVRAVGTAFNVRLQPDRVEVLVTEGKVHVDNQEAPAQAVLSQPLLVAGERAVISTRDPEPQAVVAAVDARQIEQALAWQHQRLEFSDQPLTAIVAEFNRHGSTKLVLGDPALANLRIGGNFRADNAEAFVRLLESAFGVRAERRGDVTVLYLRR